MLVLGSTTKSLRFATAEVDAMATEINPIANARVEIFVLKSETYFHARGIAAGEVGMNEAHMHTSPNKWDLGMTREIKV